jgi:CheY-like chemotaxis protein
MVAVAMNGGASHLLATWRSVPLTNVLVVDDDAETRLAIRTALEDEGHAVLEAGRGDKALHVLQEHPSPLVVLLDHIMPEMTAAELLTLVAADHSLLQRHAYIEMTAASRRAFSPEFLALLTSMHIPVVSKPFDLDTLLDVVAEQAGRLRRGGLPSHPEPVIDDDKGGTSPQPGVFRGASRALR